MAKFKLTTPVGTARYAWLNKADVKFNAEGEYKVDLIVEEKAAAKFVKACKAYFADEKVKADEHVMPWSQEKDDNGDLTGNLVFKIKAKNRAGWDRKPPIFDCAEQPQKIDDIVTSGSKIKVNVELYATGVFKGSQYLQLQPLAVQVLELAEGNNASASDFGFGGDKDGFVSDGKATVEDESDDGSTVSEEKDDFDF